MSHFLHNKDFSGPEDDRVVANMLTALKISGEDDKFQEYSLEIFNKSHEQQFYFYLAEILGRFNQPDDAKNVVNEGLKIYPKDDGLLAMKIHLNCYYGLIEVIQCTDDSIEFRKLYPKSIYLNLLYPNP